MSCRFTIQSEKVQTISLGRQKRINVPRVSVIIPTYNAGRLVCQAIDSVLNQTFSDYEIIVVDDGSTDDTIDRLTTYGDSIYYIYQENRGRSAARNRGIHQARGQYIAFLDADDCWLPDKLNKQITLIESHRELGLVYSWAQAIYGDEKRSRILGQDFDQTGVFDAFEGLTLGKSIPILTVIVKREYLQQAGGFDEEITVVEDWALWLRVALQCKFGFVPKVLAFYRLSGKCLPEEWAQYNVQETRISAIRKAFALAPETSTICLSPDLESRALSRAFFQGSLTDYAVGDISSAKDRFAKAIDHDPKFFFEARDEWLESLVSFAMLLYDTGASQSTAEEFMIRVFEQLPNAAFSLRHVRHKAMGTLKAGYAFWAQQNRQPLVARQLMRRACRYYPLLLLNLGIVSICIQGTFLDRIRRSLKATSRIRS